MDVTGHLSGRPCRTTLRFQDASAAVFSSRKVKMLTAIDDRPGRFQGFARGACVNVLVGIEGKISARERPIFTSRFVEDRDVRCDFLPFVQPMQQSGCAVGSVCRQAVGLDAELFLRSDDHCFGRSNLRLTDGACRLNINDYGTLDVDQVVVRIGKEGVALDPSRPLTLLLIERFLPNLSSGRRNGPRSPDMEQGLQASSA
jgi:hypothetical protein